MVSCQMSHYRLLVCVKRLVLLRDAGLLLVDFDIRPILGVQTLRLARLTVAAKTVQPAKTRVRIADSHRAGSSTVQAGPFALAVRRQKNQKKHTKNWICTGTLDGRNAIHVV